MPDDIREVGRGQIMQDLVRRKFSFLSNVNGKILKDAVLQSEEATIRSIRCYKILEE